MASRYFHSRCSGLYDELKVTISNDLVFRSKRPFEDFQEGEQALQPDAKKQQCGLPFSFQKTSLASAVPSSPSNVVGASQVYSQIPDEDSDLDSTILELSDEDSPDSPFNGTLEEEDRLLADDLDDTSHILLFRSVLRTPNGSPEPLHPTGLSVYPSSVLPYSSAPADPEGGNNASVDSQNQMGLNLSPDRLGLQAATPIEASSFSLKKGDSESELVEKRVIQVVGEQSSPVSLLKAEHEFDSVVTDRPSEGKAFIDQSEVARESTSNPPCEGASSSAAKVAPDHFITAQNEDHAEDPSPGESEKPSSEDPSSDDPKRRRIFIPEEELQLSKEKYVASVVAHAENVNIIGKPVTKAKVWASRAIQAFKKFSLLPLPTGSYWLHASNALDAVNELHELMGKVTSEYHFQEPSYRHPTNLTMRNYAKRRNREIQKCSLESWVNQNLRHKRRFADIPDKFERSPIPSR